jgi:prophage maintenance system killer protein
MAVHLPPQTGWEIVADEEESSPTVIALASGRLTKTGLTSWLKEHSSRLAH